MYIQLDTFRDFFVKNKSSTQAASVEIYMHYWKLQSRKSLWIMDFWHN